MKYSLSTTAKLVVDSEDYDRRMQFSAGHFTTAAVVYLQYSNTKHVIALLDSDASSTVCVTVAAGRRIEAYVDAGTADLAVVKECGENRVQQ